MGILWIILIGAAAGVIARLLAPGPNNPSGFILTVVLASWDHFSQRSLAKRSAGIVPTRERALSARRSALSSFCLYGIDWSRIRLFPIPAQVLQLIRPTVGCPLCVKSRHVQRTSLCPLSATSGHRAFDWKSTKVVGGAHYLGSRSHSRQWEGRIGTILLRIISDQPTPLRRHGNANA